MVNPALANQLLQQLAGQVPVSSDDLEARARQGRLTFAATIAASRSDCQCEPCQLLRKALDGLLADARKDIAIDSPP